MPDKIRLFQRASFVLAGVSLFACNAVKPVDYQNRLETAEICCTNLAELRSQQLTKEKPTVQLQLGNEKSQAINVDKVKTFAALVRLPATAEPYSLKIQSLPVNNAIMPPKIRLLKEDFSTSREFGANQFRAQQGLYQRTVFLNPENLDERYLLVYHDNSSLDTNLKKTDIRVNSSSVALPGGGMFMFSTASGDINSTIQGAMGGSVIVTYEKYAPEDLVKPKAQR